MIQVSEATATSGEAPRRAGGVPKVVVSSRLEDFSAFWPRAADPAPGVAFHVFQSAEFLEVWYDTIGRARGITPCFCAVRDEAGAPLMLLALGIEKRNGVRVLTFLDGGVSDYNGPVLFPDAAGWDARQSRAVLDAVFAALPPFDIALFEKMPPDVLGRANPLMQLPTTLGPMGGHASQLAESWEAFLAARGKPPSGGGGRFAQRYRQLKRLMPVAYVAADATNSEALLEQLFAQKEARFAETRVPGFADQPGMMAFYREATRHLLGVGLVHLCAVMAGDHPIGLLWSMQQGTRKYVLVSGYDSAQEWEKFSPGRILFDEAMKWSHEQGFAVADFGVGDEAYKFQYCDVHITLHDAMVPVTLRGRAYAAYRRTLTWLRGTRLWQAARPYKWVLLRGLKS